jgi:hypothetical protein
LKILKRSEITISIAKYYFAIFLIQILEYYIFRLNLNTIQEKIKIIRNFKFPLFLNQLKNIIGFFEYYRKFVEYYAALSKPFIKLKTKDFKDTFIKNYDREKYTLHIFLNSLIIPEKLLLYEITFENLKWKLVNIPILAFFNFNKSFIFYVDGSKEKKYKAELY